MHRPRLSYSIREPKSDRLICTVFTDVKICRLPSYDISKYVDIVMGSHVVRIERSEAARLLRNARARNENVERHPSICDSNSFCNVYCQ